MGQHCTSHQYTGCRRTSSGGPMRGPRLWSTPAAQYDAVTTPPSAEVSADADAARHPFITDADEFTSKVLALRARMEQFRNDAKGYEDAANRAIDDASMARAEYRNAERELMQLVGIDR